MGLVDPSKKKNDYLNTDAGRGGQYAFDSGSEQESRSALERGAYNPHTVIQYGRPEAPTYDYQYQAYTPGSFNYKNQALYDAALNNYANFKYDPTNDQSYQTYARQYRRNGADAYEGTMAQLASRTGGVGSSYAAAAAQQAYNNYMQDLSNKVPELEQIAYGRVQDQYNLWNQDRQLEYNMWNQAESRRASAWNAQQKALQEAALNKYNAELGAYNSKLYGASYDAVLDQIKSGNMTKEQAANYLKSMTTNTNVYGQKMLSNAAANELFATYYGGVDDEAPAPYTISSDDYGRVLAGAYQAAANGNTGYWDNIDTTGMDADQVKMVYGLYPYMDETTTTTTTSKDGTTKETTTTKKKK